MFIRGWVRTLLVWAGLILFWLLHFGVIGYGEPYDVTVGNWVYTYRDTLDYFWFLYVLAITMSLTGCYIWTRLKNRHWGFAFWGLLTPIGLLGIALLKDKALKPTEAGKD